MALSMFSRKNKIKEVPKPREYDMDNVWDVIDYCLKGKAGNIVDTLSAYFDKHPDQLEARNSSEQTPLLKLMSGGIEYRIRDCSLEVLDVFISRDANLDAADHYKKTCLMHLISNRNYKEASLVLESDADDQLETNENHKVDNYIQNEQGYECLMRARSGRLMVMSDDIVEVVDFPSDIKEKLRTVFNVSAQTVVEMYGRRGQWNSISDEWKILRTDRFSELGDDLPPRLNQAIELLKQRKQEQAKTAAALNKKQIGFIS